MGVPTAIAKTLTFLPRGGLGDCARRQGDLWPPRSRLVGGNARGRAALAYPGHLSDNSNQRSPGRRADRRLVGLWSQ